MGELKLLDTIIGMIFVYLVLSMMCTAAVEAIASFLRLRSINLTQAIIWLLNPRTTTASQPTDTETPAGSVRPSWRERLGWWIMGQRFDGTPAAASNGETSAAPSGTLARALLEHPLIYRLAPGDKTPAYIAPRFFASALIDLFSREVQAANGGGTAPVSDAFKDVGALVDKLDNEELKRTLQPVIARALATAKTEEEKMQAGIRAIEDWFHQSMERVGGWYRERIQRVTLVVALLLTVMLNADTVKIARTLWTDDALRTTFVQAATEAAKNENALKLNCPSQQSSTNASGDAQAALECWTSEIGRLNGKLRDLPIGWKTELPTSGWDVAAWFIHIPGWLLTAFAVSLGAPFWFDLLGRFVSLRSAGERPNGERKGGNKKADDSPTA